MNQENTQVGRLSSDILREYVFEAKSKEHKAKSLISNVDEPTIDLELVKSLAEEALEGIVKSARKGELLFSYALAETTSDEMLTKVAYELQSLCPGIFIKMKFGSKELVADWAGKNEA